MSPSPGNRVDLQRVETVTSSSTSVRGRPGPLGGLRVVETAGPPPARLAALLLAHLGADVITVDQASACDPGPAAQEPPQVGERNPGHLGIAVDLMHPRAQEVMVELVRSADVLIDAFRPAAIEPLGLGPKWHAQLNPRLVCIPMTTWAEDGFLSGPADLDDPVAITGVPHTIGQRLDGTDGTTDGFGDSTLGGIVAVVVLAALHERNQSGIGQVVDASSIDGAALFALTSLGRPEAAQVGASLAQGQDAETPYYGAYETADGQFVAVSAVDTHSYSDMIRRLRVPVIPTEQDERATWPRTRALIAGAFRRRTLAQWSDIFAGSSALVTPIASAAEAPPPTNNAAPSVFGGVGRIGAEGKAPQPGGTIPGPRVVGDGRAGLTAWGVAPLLVDGAIAANALQVAGPQPRAFGVSP